MTVTGTLAFITKVAVALPKMRFAKLPSDDLHTMI